MSKATFRRPQTSIDAFKHPDQRDIVQQIRDRLDDLERATGVAGFVKAGKASPLPPRSQINVFTDPVKAPGHFFVEIRNPEYDAVNPLNPIRTPIIHQLESSSAADFSTDLKSWPPGVQTSYTITEFGASTRYFRVKSSIDGKNFTQPVPLGPFTS